MPTGASKRWEGAPRRRKRTGPGSAGKGGFKYNLDIDFFLPNGMVPQGAATGAECCEVDQEQSADGGGGDGGRDRQEGQVRLLVFYCGQNWDNAVTDVPGKPPARRVLIRHPESCVALTIFFLLSFSRFCSSCSAVRLYSCRPTEPRGRLRNNRVAS